MIPSLIYLMKEALYQKKMEKNAVLCSLCPHNCIIPENKFGFCNARKNIKGTLYSLVYGKSVSAAIDPIEKKPLYHFYPGSTAFSIGTVGCNLRCKQCQNWQTSQAKPGEFFTQDLAPEQIVDAAVNNGCKAIAYTYNEPTIFYEYMLDTAKRAKKSGIKNVMVSNGYINQEPLQELCKYMDGVNCDLKSFENNFYKKICAGTLSPVLDTLKILKKSKVWFEIAYLIIPTLNEDLVNIKKMCIWIKKNLGTAYPLHFTAFYPCYKLDNLPKTPSESQLKAREIALKVGLQYVYAGNVSTAEGNNTYCPNCKKLLIERYGFSVLANNLVNGNCSCGHKIAGTFA
jgi:pyruvate formate lyase activating enzyme